MVMIFNMSNRDKGELSIFTGDEWLKLDGNHATYIYKMHDKIGKLQDLLEMLHERAKIEVVNYKYESEYKMVEDMLNGK